MPTNDKTQARYRRSLGPMLLEVFFIMLGVMVALAANEWREGRALDKRTDAALENIRLEILRNQQTLQQRLPYHEALHDSLTSYLPELRNVSFQDVDGRRLGMSRGSFFIIVYDAAWQTALTSQTLPNVDFETLTLLSNIYQFQAYLKTIEERATSVMTPANVQGENLYYAFILFRLSLMDIVELEQNLLSFYDAALQRLSPEEYIPAPPND
ncbi:MAG: hypothetical protein ACE10K_15985 [Rhodothermales bacterium]